MEKRYKKYYPYIDPVLLQHKDIIFAGNDKCIKATHFCILNKALSNQLWFAHNYPKIVYIAEDPKNIYRDLAGLNICGVRINNFMMNWYKEPVIIIVNPFEFLSMHLKKDTLIMIGDTLLTTLKYKQLCQARSFSYVDFTHQRQTTANLLSVNIELYYLESLDAKIEKLINICEQSYKLGIFADIYKKAKELYMNTIFCRCTLTTLNVAKCKGNNIKPSLKKAKEQNAIKLSTKFNILK